MKRRIAIVNSSTFGVYFPEHLKRLSAIGELGRFDLPPDIEGKALARALHGCHVIIASVNPYFGPEFFACEDTTLMIARHGIGVDNIHLPSASQKGVFVTRVPGWVEREAVAELEITLLLDVMRRTNEAMLQVHSGQWSERSRFLGCEIKGKVVGIIGIGSIGTRFCDILRVGFGAHMIAYDPYLSPEVIHQRGAEPVELDTLLARSDIVSLSASLNDDNHHLLAHEEFGLLKSGAFIVNIGRGELIDGAALIGALESGKVAGVGLDVVDGEPIGEHHPLLRYKNVVIVPHIGAYTRESLYLMGETVVENVERLARGDPLVELVNEEVVGRGPIREWQSDVHDGKGMT